MTIFFLFMQIKAKHKEKIYLISKQILMLPTVY